MTGREYEYAAASWLRRKGYQHVRVTQASGDYGVDITASRLGIRYAVQCKHYSHPVGIAAVQEAVAGQARYRCDRAMVITNATFTKAAKELAESNHVLLYEHAELRRPFLTPEATARLRALLALLWITVAVYAGCAVLMQHGWPQSWEPFPREWELPLLLLAVPPLLALLTLGLQSLMAQLLIRLEIRREKRAAHWEARNAEDLQRCVRLANAVQKLPPQAYMPGKGHPNRQRMQQFFPDSRLIRHLLERLGKKRGFSQAQLRRRMKLEPQAARELTTLLVRSGFLICTRPSHYAWSRLAVSERRK